MASTSVETRRRWTTLFITTGARMQINYVPSVSRERLVSGANKLIRSGKLELFNVAKIPEFWKRELRAASIPREILKGSVIHSDGFPLFGRFRFSKEKKEEGERGRERGRIDRAEAAHQQNFVPAL